MGTVKPLKTRQNYIYLEKPWCFTHVVYLMQRDNISTNQCKLHYTSTRLYISNKPSTTVHFI